MLATHYKPLRDTYKAWLTAGGAVFESICPGQEIPELAAYDALLLTGGGDIEPSRYGETVLNDSVKSEPGRDELEFSLLNSFLTMDKPIAGICRGLQIINVYFGGTLWQDLPVPLGLTHTGENGNDRIHPVVWSDGLKQEVNSYHHQAVRESAGCLRVCAQAPDGIIEAAAHVSLPVRGVQWHPERLPFDRAVWNFLWGKTI